MKNLFLKVAECWRKEFDLINRIWVDQYPVKPQWPLSLLEKLMMSLMVLFRMASVSPLKHLAPNKEIGTQWSEHYVLIRLVLLVILLIVQYRFPYSAVLVGYLLFEGFNNRLCIIFVDKYDPQWSLRSLNRSLMLLVINYVEMIIGFASLYLWSNSIVNSSKLALSGPGDAFYFSVVTITTLGYGDFIPNDALGKFLVSSEALMGVIFLVLVFSMFVSGIQNHKNVNKKERKG